MENLGFTAIPAITVICYLIAQVVKATAVDNKWLPIVCGIAGAVLGIIAMHTMTDFVAGDYLTAIAVGIVSGLAATGVNQAVKQLQSKARRIKIMKKLFISQPMRGKSDEVILQERANAIQSAKDSVGDTIVVLDTYFSNFNGKPLEFLGKSIMMLAGADVAYFAPGWQNARGCRIENICAKEYGIPVIEA